MPSSPSSADRWLSVLLRGLAAVAAGIVVLIFAYLVLEAWPALRAIGPRRFLTDATWNPTGRGPAASFGLGAMVAGTLAATAGAILIAGPLGLLAAIFGRFYAPPFLGALHRRAVELLAGIPSVVYGLWGLSTLAPWIRRLEPPGTSLLAGILVLALMIVPTVALLADTALRAARPAELQAAAALSLTRWTTLRGVVLPAARPGLAVAVLLGTTRALGETMAVVMVCGNVVRVPASLFDPVRTLTANIALELGYATADHRSALFVSGLFLVAAVTVLVLLAEGRRGGRRAA